MKDICVFFATGYEEVEALTVVDIVRRAGLPLKMVSITDELEVTSAHQVTVKMDALLKDLDFEQVEMIVLPGGIPGTPNLEACEPLMAQLDKFYQEKRPISSICAAPSIFGHRGYLKGRCACSYPSFESHLEGATVSKERAVVDDFITTGRGMGCAISFALAIVERYQGAEAAQKIADAIVYF